MSTQQSKPRLRRRTLALLMGAAVAASLGFAGAGTAVAAQAGTRAQPDLECRLAYHMTGWSAIVERAEGSGRVTCKNGQSMAVSIRVVGGGLTAGKWQINDGKGRFTDVHNIRDVLGDYAAASANAGVVHSAGAQVLTKGPVSLALAGKGRGINLGISGTKFTIAPLK